MTTLLVLLAVEAPLLALLVLSYRRENQPAVSNTVVAALVTGTPAVVERALGALGGGPLSFTPLLTLWIGVASVVHSVGMLGWYESVGWWDHLTHTLSAALGAALIYAALIVGVGPSPNSGTLHLAVGTLAAMLVLSLLWEAAEVGMRELGEHYDVEPALVNYGWRDTGLDLVFDLLGTVLVLAVDLRLFVSVFEQLAAAF